MAFDSDRESSILQQNASLGTVDGWVRYCDRSMSSSPVRRAGCMGRTDWLESQSLGSSVNLTKGRSSSENNAMGNSILVRDEM